MSLAEFLYFLAFTTYIIGACWSLRSDGRKAAVIVLIVGVISDVLVTALAMFGPEAFDMGATGRNFAIDLGAVLGAVVWTLALCMLVAWYMQRKPLFHVLTVATLLVWFVAYLAFLYGLHVYPMT
ncbi:hypothetical protein Paes_0962 [Prosthecochloris aestuarii DSM 271]|uniref:Uncharacterized protein n=1 Tax=Prosthecochloris aestuarii (strain DSM 271 / SK 413) TaxID=290512 RepID=B4S7G8_PROA2|nr:hypothetical protein [Prosthecochloris aestuarii]ACF46005.1 hypothetical protein Paes_0962 [Prosthecochloris aestuarii DSM 271]